MKPFVEEPLGFPFFEEDLTSLACQAAVELDNLILHRPTQLHAVHKLATTIRDVVSVPEPSQPSSLLDPTTAVALHKAIGGLKTLEQLLEHVRDVTTRLGKASPTGGAQDWKQLRDFCLALSQHAGTLVHPPDEVPNHPLRR